MSIAARYLDTELVPALETTLDKEYWTLKNGSPLRAYFDALPNHARRPDNYVTPADLISLIRDQFYMLDLCDPGNTDIVHLVDTPFQSCFLTPIVYAPDLYQLCLPHVNIVDHYETLQDLKHKAVKHELSIESPATLLYLDPTAKFWIPPVFNQIVCQNKDISYSWTELCQLFITFFTTPNAHVKRINGSVYAIRPTSELADYLNFEHIDHNQIVILIKHLAKYLGKTSTMLTLCPKLTFTQCKQSDPVVYWLENTIATNNKHGSPRTLDLLLI